MVISRVCVKKVAYDFFKLIKEEKFLKKEVNGDEINIHYRYNNENIIVKYLKNLGEYIIKEQDCYIDDDDEHFLHEFHEHIKKEVRKSKIKSIKNDKFI